MKLTINGYTFSQRQKQADLRLNQWAKAADCGLYNVYKNPSEAKIRAYEWCKRIAHEVHGTMLKCPCGSHDIFTASFVTLDPENGNIDRVFWITPQNLYYANVN